MKIERLIVVSMLTLAMTSNAYAYIDPGTGSVVTTAILGFFAAIAFTFRKYMYRAKDWLTGKRTHVEGDRKDRSGQ